MEERAQPYEIVILVCTNRREEGKAACGNRGSEPFREILKTVMKERGFKGRIRVTHTGCLGQCDLGPNIMVFPEGAWFSGVKEEDLPGLISRYFGEKLNDDAR